MLTSIRERATGWIAWAIVILITIPFALWGVNSYFTGLTEIDVAQVDGIEIDYQEYQRALYAERDRVRGQFGSNASPELLSGEVLGRRVVERMVNDVLLSRDAEDNGYRVSDQQLASFIRAERAFQTDDQFDQTRYERVLQISGYSPAQFEGVQRASAAVQQIYNGFALSSLSIDQTVDDYMALSLQERLGQYAVIDSETLLSEIEVDQAAVQAIYDSNPDAYREPARMQIEFLELKVDDFAVDYEPSQEELERIYDSRTEDFLNMEQRSISHILIELSEDAQDADSDAQSLAQKLADRARAGNDFAALAREYSKDSGSAQAGGSLGFINRGVTVPEFEAVAFSLPVGEISDPVRSQFGYHVIRVDEIRAERIKTFEEAREELTKIATRQAAEAEMFDVVEEIRNITYEQPETLDPLRESLGFALEVSDWFSLGRGEGIASHQAVRQSAFSDQVRNDGFNSDVIELDIDHFVVLRMRDYHEAEQLPLEEVEAEIREEILVDKSSERATEIGNRLIEQLKASEQNGWNEIIADYGLESTDLSVEGDDAENLRLPEILFNVYSAPKPTDNSVSYGGAPLSDGAFFVYRITAVVEGDVAQTDSAQREQVNVLLQQRFGDALFSGHLDSLRTSADIQIHEDVL